MRRLRALWMRFVGIVLRRDENDFVTELESHVALHIEDGIRAGLGPVEARRQALVRLGGVEQTRQAYRERRGLPWIESLIRDFAYSARTLSKHRGITSVAVLSIGLGIGSNATIFSMVSRFVLRPPPMGDPSSLVTIHTMQEGDQCCNPFSWPLYSDLRDQAKSFSGIAAYYELIPASISGSGEPERVWGQGVTTNFFDVTELHMLLGRGFVSGEDRMQEIVLAAGLWQRRFNADKNIVGKSITLSGHTYTVVGVAPPAFHSVDQILYTEFWVPLGNAAQLVPNLLPESARGFHWLVVVARLNPGVTQKQAAAELSTLANRFALNNPATDKGNTFVFEQAGSLPPRDRTAVLIFMTTLSVVALLVLSIASANVANLLFAQAVSRQRDMAVRLALGATRARLRRQLLTEGVLLGLGGGVLGVLLSTWATRALSVFHLPAPVPLDVSIGVDWRVLLFAFILSVTSGLLLGAAPAWSASHPLLSNALKGEVVFVRSGHRINLRDLLVVTQISMCVVLLCVTGLFLRSLQSATSIDIGFRPQHLLVMSVDPRVHGYTSERTAEFLNQMRERVAVLPGVVSAVSTDVAPLSGGNRSDRFTVLGPSAKNTTPSKCKVTYPRRRSAARTLPLAPTKHCRRSIPYGIHAFGSRRRQPVVAHGTGEAADPPTRSHHGCLQRRDDGGARSHRILPAPSGGNAVRHLWVYRIGAGRRRPLRSHELRGEPPHAGDRNSNGPGCTTRHGRAPCTSPGIGAHACCHGAGLAGSVDALQTGCKTGCKLSIRHTSARCIHIYFSAAPSACNRTGRLLVSRSTCGFN
jgi:ABC-type antimicrobial peptide transport system permease subunit